MQLIQPADLVGRGPTVDLLPKHTKLEEVLRRAMRRAGLVTGYVHKCRRQGCGHREPAPRREPPSLPEVHLQALPGGEVRKIRFHHLRHTTASLLLMSGADLAAVQRIMRHQDPRLTTEVYGHLSANYLRKANRAPQLRSAACGRRQDPALGGRRIGAAAARRHPRERAHCGSVSDGIYYPATTRPPSGALGAPLAPKAATEFRELKLVGARGFEPPTFRSRTERATRLRHAPYFADASMPNLPRASQRRRRRSDAGSRIRRSSTSARKRARTAKSSSGARSGWRVSRWSAPRVEQLDRIGDDAAAGAGGRGPQGGRPLAARARRAGGGRSSGANGRRQPAVGLGDRGARRAAACA